MKLTKSKLKQIIKEEIQAVLKEGFYRPDPFRDDANTLNKMKSLCKQGYKAACHALEWVEKCEAEDGYDRSGKQSCLKAIKLLKSYEDQHYGFGDDPDIDYNF
jgi:hypothetical protein